MRLRNSTHTLSHAFFWVVVCGATWSLCFVLCTCVACSSDHSCRQCFQSRSCWLGGGRGEIWELNLGRADSDLGLTSKYHEEKTYQNRWEETPQLHSYLRERAVWGMLRYGSWHFLLQWVMSGLGGVEEREDLRGFGYR